MAQAKRKKNFNRTFSTGEHSERPRTIRGYTLLETVVILAVLLLLVTIVSVTYFGNLMQRRLDADVGEFARTLRLAAEHAVLRGESFAVVISVYDGKYTVYPANIGNYYSEADEPLVESRRLERCWIDEIEFEDGTTQYSGEIILQATPQGWGASLVVNMLDKDDRARYLRCDNSTTNVVVDRHPLYLLEPQTDVSMFSPL